MQTGEGVSILSAFCLLGWCVLLMMPLKCKANPSLASPSRVHGDWIQFWTTDDLHGETPFDAVEPGEGGVQDEDTQGFGLIEIELL